MVMDRVDGVDLLTDLARRPWHARRVGIMLADLHRRLAAIPLEAVEAADVPTRFGPRESYVHLDLHPGNMLLTADGPIVIDWEGAGAGPRDADTATTWLLLAVAEPDDVPRLVRPLVGSIKRIVLRTFLRRVETPRASEIAAVCRERLRDPNMKPVELERIRSFASQHSP